MSKSRGKEISTGTAKATGSRLTRRRDRASSSPVADSGSSVKRIVVDHTYKDHLNDPEEVQSTIQLIRGGSRPQRGPRGGVTIAFPEKLHEMLTRMDEEALGHIVTWQPHGRCFVVHRKKEFINDVMPRFFHQSKLTSFQRQLNLYGFVRLTVGRDRGGYYHELFLRGRPDLCRRMTRTRVKGNGMKAASNPQNEPDFYTMKFCPALSPNATSKISETDGETSECTVESEKPATVAEPQTENVEKEVKSNLITPVPSPRPGMDFSKSEPSQFSLLDMVIDIPSMEFAFASELKDEEGCLDSIMDEEKHLESGDEVFFEGLKFRYLDRLDHLDLEKEYNVGFAEHFGVTDGL